MDRDECLFSLEIEPTDLAIDPVVHLHVQNCPDCRLEVAEIGA